MSEACGISHPFSASIVSPPGKWARVLQYAVPCLFLLFLACTKAPAERLSITPLRCLSHEAISAIRRNPEMNLSKAFAQCETEFSTRLSSFKMRSSDIKFVFSAIAAHEMAPYGESTVLNLPSLLQEKHLDCDNYIVLAGHFAKLLSPGRQNDVMFVGVDGKAVGNHAQIFFRLSDGREVLADPTIGLYANASFNHLFSGKKLASDQIVVMYAHRNPELAPFVIRVHSAIRDGQYHPSDLLYYSQGLDRFLRFSDGLAPFWRGGRKSLPELIARYPTPAASELEKTLNASMPR